VCVLPLSSLLLFLYFLFLLDFIFILYCRSRARRAIKRVAIAIFPRAPRPPRASHRRGFGFLNRSSASPSLRPADRRSLLSVLLIAEVRPLLEFDQIPNAGGDAPHRKLINALRDDKPFPWAFHHLRLSVGIIGCYVYYKSILMLNVLRGSYPLRLAHYHAFD
jgi:hypothetical protein